MTFGKFVKSAKKNRQNFLKPYRKKFEAAKTDRQKAKIAIELLRIEPSHINEPWISRAVERWMLDPKCRDYLDAIKPVTDLQRLKAVRDEMVYNRIKKIRKRDQVSIRKACEKLAEQVHGRAVEYWLLWQVSDPDLDLVESIRNSYNRHKIRIKKGPPAPYYGRDVRANPHG
jgi:hypothetical protein